MAKLNVRRICSLLENFQFQPLFIEALGWSRPTSREKNKITVDGIELVRRQIARLGRIVVFEVLASDGQIPNAKVRQALYQESSRRTHENLLIFLDEPTTQSLWFWMKQKEGKQYPREYLYVHGQPGHLFLSKLDACVVDLGDFKAREHWARTGREALNIERVAKKFWAELKKQHVKISEQSLGISHERERHWYISLLLNRLMFVYFLQRKGLLDDSNRNYLEDKLAESQQRGPDRYYSEFLQALFAKPSEERSAKARALCQICDLDATLFRPLPTRLARVNLRIPDQAFEDLFDLFRAYSWNLHDTPSGQDNEINPDVLGYIFEKQIDQKAPFSTHPEITDYLCEHTINQLILEQVHSFAVLSGRHFDSIEELLMALDPPLCKLLLRDVLPRLSLLDPACGCGSFLVAAMKTLINIYSAVIGKMKLSNDSWPPRELAAIERHPTVSYYIKKRIITDNLFGVDLMEEATEIAKWRLFLALVASAPQESELESLPNVDFNILSGNSLIGLLKLNGHTRIFCPSFHQNIAEKKRLIDRYRHTIDDFTERQSWRDKIEQLRKIAQPVMNEVLLDEFRSLGIRYEQARWNVGKNKAGKPKTRDLTVQDIKTLRPLHWGYEFDEVMNVRGGFDAIITKPPWNIFKPNAKEFFAEYCDEVTLTRMPLKKFKVLPAQQLRNPQRRAEWLAYLSDFQHVRAYYRKAAQYENQTSHVNLYQLFLEQCVNLLRDGGRSGLVIPSGIYTDLGTKQLREMLFSQTRVTGLFGFSNRRMILEGVAQRSKFVVLTFTKGGTTKAFPAAFMRHDVAELKDFPQQIGLDLSVGLIRRLSPNSLSVMEFHNQTDVCIAEKIARFPLLGEKIKGLWNLSLTSEFNMANDRYLFKTQPASGRLPLYEGKMIHQFDHQASSPRYWVDESEGRAASLRRTEDNGQKLDYQTYRLGFRYITRNTDARTMISTIIPPAFHGNSIPTVKIFKASLISEEQETRRQNGASQLYLCAVWNSFVLDWFVRKKVTSRLNFFHIYELNIPRLTARDRFFSEIVERAAKLICTTPEFDNLAQAVGLAGHKEGVTNKVQRTKLRAELDGYVAHLYNLTEKELVHILKTFPLVPEPHKVAAQNAYRDIERGVLP